MASCFVEKRNNNQSGRVTFVMCVLGTLCSSTILEAFAVLLLHLPMAFVQRHFRYPWKTCELAGLRVEQRAVIRSAPGLLWQVLKWLQLQNCFVLQNQHKAKCKGDVRLRMSSIWAMRKTALRCVWSTIMRESCANTNAVVVICNRTTSASMQAL